MVIFSPQMIAQICPLLWSPKYEKILPIGLVVELSSEQQTSLPNRLALPIVVF